MLMATLAMIEKVYAGSVFPLNVFGITAQQQSKTISSET